MAKYDASRVEDIEVDFSKFGIERVIVPEPSSDPIVDFWEGLRDSAIPSFKEPAQGTEGEPGYVPPVEWGPTERAEEIKRRNRQLDKVLAAVCSDAITADQFEQLPHRAVQGFTNWLADEVFNPKASTGATND
jgi:hypothetical protein